MTLVIPSLVSSKVSIAYTSILIRQTVLLTSTTLLVIRVLPLMMQVYSTAHTFLFRWFVQLERTPSSPKSDLRLATAWSLIPSLKVQLSELVLLQLTRTATTVALQLRTSCDSSGCCGSGCPTCPFRPPSRGVFFYANK